MKNVVWKEAIRTCADPPRVQHYLDQLKSTGAAAILKSPSAEQARILAALLSGSQVLSEMLSIHPNWLSALNPELLQYPRQEQGIRREVNGWFKPLLQVRDVPGAFARLREFKQREMLRIAARDLARLGTITEITSEISNVADVCLDSVYHICLR